MTRRGEAMIKALEFYQPLMRRVKVLNAENWLEFFKDIKGTKFSELRNMSKVEIKQKLSDQAIALEMEPLLAKHRKVVATIYLEAKSTEIFISDSSILGDFKKAVSTTDIDKARSI